MTFAYLADFANFLDFVELAQFANVENITNLINFTNSNGKKTVVRYSMESAKAMDIVGKFNHV